jgi:hypothetical protein
MPSPTSRTLALLKTLGADPIDIVEHWNPFSKTRHDLFGFADILCVVENKITAVQCTTHDNASARRKKIANNDGAEKFTRAGGRILLITWGKAGPRHPKVRPGCWFPRVEDLRFNSEKVITDN